MANNNSFRFDNRTKDEFIRDIKSGHKAELEIAVRYCCLLKQKAYKWPKLKGVGVDFTGKFIESTKDVTSYPDFIVDDKVIEITRADTLCREFFHEKVGKVNKCVQNGHSLMFVNGFKAKETPSFILLGPDKLDMYTKSSKEEYGLVKHPGTGGKEGYRYCVTWFKWETLPKINDNIPDEYRDMLKSLATV